jgi:hypothetical protein
LVADRHGAAPRRPVFGDGWEKDESSCRVTFIFDEFIIPQNFKIFYIYVNLYVDSNSSKI